MAAIKIRGLTKRYADQASPALASLDLDVADGELLVLVGPSGCGKSTALRLIAGLEEPTKGSIKLAGENLATVPPQRRDVAMVFQGYALYPHLSVRDNIAFPLKMRGVSSEDRAHKTKEIAALVQLSDKLDRLPQELSGGERQRVAMGRAIVRDPKVFLFDEPLSNLDAKLRAELRVELVALVRRLGTTAIYVTHDQAEAMTMGDRVAVLHGGTLQQVAPPREIYTKPGNLTVAGFVGTPAMNLLVLPCDGVDFGREDVTVGFRPEHVRIGEGDQIRATVRAVEPLGAETFVYMTCGDEPLRARVEGFAELEVGDDVQLSVADEHLLWFDTQGGGRLS